MSVHPTAIVEDGVELGADVEIGPYAVVRAGTVDRKSTRLNSSH